MEVILKTSSTNNNVYPEVSVEIHLSSEESSALSSSLSMSNFSPYSSYDMAYRLLNVLKITNLDLINILPITDSKKEKIISTANKINNINYTISQNNIFSGIQNQLKDNNVRWNKASSQKVTAGLSKLIKERIRKKSVLEKRKFKTQTSSPLSTSATPTLSLPEIDTSVGGMELRIGERFFTLEEIDKRKKFKSILSSIKSELGARGKNDRTSLVNALSVMERNMNDDMATFLSKQKHSVPMARYSKDFFHEHQITVYQIADNYVRLNSPVEFALKEVMAGRKKAILKNPIELEGMFSLSFHLGSDGSFTLQVIYLLDNSLNRMIYHPHIYAGDGKLCTGSVSTDCKLQSFTETSIITYVLPLLDKLKDVLEVVNADSWYTSGCNQHSEINKLVNELKGEVDDDYPTIREDCELYQKSSKRYWGRKANEGDEE